MLPIRPPLCLPVLLLAASLAHAQPLAFHAPRAASGRDLHDARVSIVTDAPSGTLAPGQMITVRVIVAWDRFGGQFAGLRADTLATGDLGLVGMIESDLGPRPPLVLVGEPRGGSIVGTDVAVIPSALTPTATPASQRYHGFDLLRFEWTAPSPPSPIDVAFNVVPDTLAPSVRLFPSPRSPAFVEARTTYTGTSLRVLPAPGASAILLGALALAHRRQR